MMNLNNKTVVFCMDCGEYIGIHREGCANEHLKKYPYHSDFVVLTITDPLLLSNPDEWFDKRGILPDHVIDPTNFDIWENRRRLDRT